MPVLPNRNDLTVAISRFRNREELGASEALTAVQTLVIPLLAAAGHNTAELILYAGESAVGSAWRELERFTRLMERSTIELLATVDGHNPSKIEELCRSAALIELMRLVVGARIHMNVATV
jgi:hypothetical protein